MWMPVVALLLPFSYGMYISKRRQGRVGACLACGYPRTGLAAGAACPECGAGAEGGAAGAGLERLGSGVDGSVQNRE